MRLKLVEVNILLQHRVNLQRIQPSLSVLTSLKIIMLNKTFQEEKTGPQSKVLCSMRKEHLCLRIWA